MTYSSLIKEVSACTLCEPHLTLGTRPVFQIHPKAKILIAGQAPGKKVHESGVPFDDASGNRLREWLGVSRDVFYNPENIAILPMGFCYPGTGTSGDLPPRPECAPTWRDQLLKQLSHLKTTLVIGQYAQTYHFNDAYLSVTDRVKRWQTYWPHQVPLPHPSPRNNVWLRRNPWFEKELIPELRQHITNTLTQ